MKMQTGLLAALLLLSNLAGRPAQAQLLMTQEQALQQAFPPGTRIKRHTLFLNDEQVEQIQRRARAALASKLVTYYSDSSGAAPQLVFFEKNTVRTRDEIFMVIIDRSGQVQRIEMLAFYEPLDYLPPPRWLALFRGKPLSDKLWPQQEIHNITGATLTARAVTLGVRRILATFELAIKPTLQAASRGS